MTLAGTRFLSLVPVLFISSHGAQLITDNPILTDVGNLLDIASGPTLISNNLKLCFDMAPLWLLRFDSRLEFNSSAVSRPSD